MQTKTNRNQSVRTLATAKDYDGKSFKNKNMLLFELFRHQFELTGDMVLRDLTFENCQFDGPAVMLPVNNCTFDDCNFGSAQGDMRNLILYPASPEKITGAIPMMNCKFQSVDFFAVGFTGGRPFLDSLLEVPTQDVQP